MGKGDTPRQVNKEKYDANFERVFGKREIKTWNPEGDRPASGQDACLSEEPNGRTDPEAKDLVEASCLCCPGGKVFEDHYWTERLLCRKCQSNWPKEERL